MSTRRLQRVSELLREEISDLIRREVNDPRLGEVTSITEVQVSPDLRAAKVYTSILGGETDKKKTLEGLQAAAPFLRRSLMARLTLRHVPTLTFILDETIESGARLVALMKEAQASLENPSAGNTA